MIRGVYRVFVFLVDPVHKGILLAHEFTTTCC